MKFNFFFEFLNNYKCSEKPYIKHSLDCFCIYYFKIPIGGVQWMYCFPVKSSIAAEAWVKGKLG